MFYILEYSNTIRKDQFDIQVKEQVTKGFASKQNHSFAFSFW